MPGRYQTAPIGDAGLALNGPAARSWQAPSPTHFPIGPAMTPTASEDDHQLAARLAGEAGDLLVALRAQMHGAGADSRELKDEGDRQAHVLLMDALHETRPADAVLSEEGQDDQARLDADRVWIVDPLDGTREFSEPPRSDWAVHVALVIDGVAVLGAVALPAIGETLGTGPLAPALAAPVDGPPRVIVSRTATAGGRPHGGRGHPGPPGRDGLGRGQGHGGGSG